MLSLAQVERRRSCITTAAYNLFKTETNPTAPNPRTTLNPIPRHSNPKGLGERERTKVPRGEGDKGTGRDGEELRGDPNLNPTNTSKSGLFLFSIVCLEPNAKAFGG